LTAQQIETGEAIRNQEQADHLLHLQRDILEMVARNAEYKTALDALCRATETLLPNSAASIMLFDPTHTFLEVKSAPSIPNEAVDFLNGLMPRPEAGSCGTAVFNNEPVFVENPQAAPRRKNMREFSSDFNIFSCWPMPIRAQEH